MKNLFLYFSLLFFAQQAFAEEQQKPEQLTDENVPFVYESRAKLPASDETLAEFLSEDYRRARDEFTKHALMEKIAPVIKSNLADAKTKNLYFMRIRTELGQYDFKNNSFPSGFTPNTVIPFNGGKYKLRFESTQNIENVSVPLEQAKGLAEKLQRSRDATAIVFCTITGIKTEQDVFKNDIKILEAKVISAKFTLDR